MLGGQLQRLGLAPQLDLHVGLGDVAGQRAPFELDRGDGPRDLVGNTLLDLETALLVHLEVADVGEGQEGDFLEDAVLVDVEAS